MRTALQRHLVRLAEEQHRWRRPNSRLQQMQQQLIQSARLATVGKMAAWVAHEMNNPLPLSRPPCVFFKNQSREDSQTITAPASIDEEVHRIARVSARAPRLLPYPVRPRKWWSERGHPQPEPLLAPRCRVSTSPYASCWSQICRRLYIPTVSLDVTSAVACTYGCGNGRIGQLVAH